MDYQKIIEKIEAFAGIYSFEKLPDGTNGEIRLEAVNKMFEGVLTRNPQAPKFYPGIPYKYYFKEVNFEDFCYRCALTKQPMHSYVNAFGGWINGIYIPIESIRRILIIVAIYFLLHMSLTRNQCPNAITMFQKPYSILA